MDEFRRSSLMGSESPSYRLDDTYLRRQNGNSGGNTGKRPALTEATPVKSVEKTRKSPALPRNRRNTFIIAAGMFVFLALAGTAGLFIVRHGSDTAAAAVNLPKSIIQQVTGFTPYLVGTSKTNSYTLNASTVQYQNGILIFQVTNSAGKKLTITEQHIPAGFDTTSIKDAHSTVLTTPFGHGYLNDITEQTTAALFTADGTWIYVVAPDAIGAQPMTAVVRGLVAVKK
jgi:hypothetical protein